MDMLGKWCGRMSCPDPGVVQCTGALPFLAGLLGPWMEGMEVSHDGGAGHGPVKQPQHLPCHHSGELMEDSTAPFLDPTNGTRQRAERRFPQRGQGPILLILPGTCVWDGNGGKGDRSRSNCCLAGEIKQYTVGP